MSAVPQSPSFEAWVAGARVAAQQAAPLPRLPLLVAGQLVGSVVPDLWGQIDLQRLLDKRYQLSIGEQCGAPA